MRFRPIKGRPRLSMESPGRRVGRNYDDTSEMFARRFSHANAPANASVSARNQAAASRHVLPPTGFHFRPELHEWPTHTEAVRVTRLLINGIVN